MKIGIDAMGGDFAPLEAVKGASLAKQKHPHLELVLFGVKDDILRVCESESIPTSLFDIVDCPGVIEMAEHPVKALVAKPNSSLPKAFTPWRNKISMHFLALEILALCWLVHYNFLKQ